MQLGEKDPTPGSHFFANLIPLRDILLQPYDADQNPRFGEMGGQWRTGIPAGTELSDGRYAADQIELVLRQPFQVVLG